MKFDTESFGATGVIVTMTEIDAAGNRNRKTSDIMAATMMSRPYFEEVSLPEEVLDALQSEEPEEPKKWQYEKKEWWQGRWEIYLVILGAALAFYLFKKYRKYQLDMALVTHSNQTEEEDKKRSGEASDSRK